MLCCVGWKKFDDVSGEMYLQNVVYVHRAASQKLVLFMIATVRTTDLVSIESVINTFY
jgi:hypothetical protein